MTSIPYIPDNAPFNPEQRAWLNGFLAGLFSVPSAPAVSAPVASLRFGIYFASQSGTAERLAKKLAKEIKALGHSTELASLAKTTPGDLARQENALIVASTYGEGDPPESAIPFRDALFHEAAPMLGTLRYSILALGDRNYEHYCKFGIDLDERLQSLGATPIIPRTESDVDVDAPFAQWVAELKPHLSQAPAITSAAATPKIGASRTTESTMAVAEKKEASQRFTRDNPFHAELVERRALTRNVSSKLTMHLSFALEDPAMQYQAGDACGVIAENNPEVVDELLSLVPFASSTLVELARLGGMPIRDALIRHLQPTRLSRKMVQHFADRTGAKELTTLLLPEEAAQLDRYMWDRGLVDLLHEYPGTISKAAELATILPRLAPRLYSISSSPAAHHRELHCTVAIVRYRSHNRERGGVASTMLADRVGIGSRQPIYIQPNTKFRLPVAEAPMIMIGPGTGIAPFRSFLHERQALGHSGRNWLFFGERSAASDFLYCEELQAMALDGHLTRLDTAFSRDQAHKIYVQDRMIEQGAELWRWMQEGAQIYVCGDAGRMAKDVDAALHTVVERHGGMDAEAAMEFVAQLHDSRRYHRDVY